MKTVFFTILYLICFHFLTAVKLGTLDGIYNPELIKANGEEIFVVEGNRIYVYSLEGFRFVRKFDREGNGPGEFSLDRNRSAALSVFKDLIVAESRFKVVFFDREFKFLREMKKLPGIVQTVPFSEGYIVHKILYGPEGENYFTLNLYDRDMKMLKELHRQKFFNYKGKSLVVPDGINFCVLGDRIYVEKSSLGPNTDIFNRQGEKTGEIRLNEKKIPMTQKDKEEALDHFLSIPALFQAVKQRGRIEVINELKSRGGLEYPDHLPPIRDIKTDGRRLYVRTISDVKEKTKFVVLDPHGRLLGTVYLPPVAEETFFNTLQGDKKFYTFHKTGFYYLKPVVTDDEDGWEVHMERIGI